ANEPVAYRSPAADVIARGGFTAEQLLRLAEIVPRVGPMELERTLDAFGWSTDDRVGDKLLAVLPTMKSSLRVATLRPRFAKFSPAIRSKAEELFRELDADAAKQGERLELMLGKLQNGDVRRGQAVFNSQKASCIACHAVGYVGGTI